MLPQNLRGVPEQVRLPSLGALQVIPSRGGSRPGQRQERFVLYSHERASQPAKQRAVVTWVSEDLERKDQVQHLPAFVEPIGAEGICREAHPAERRIVDVDVTGGSEQNRHVLRLDALSAQLERALCYRCRLDDARLADAKGLAVQTCRDDEELGNPARPVDLPCWPHRRVANLEGLV